MFFVVQHGGKVVDVLFILRLVCTQRVELAKQAGHLCTQVLVDAVSGI